MSGKLIKYMRITRGLTQKELAAMLFIAPCSLSHYESGVRTASHALVLKAAKALNFKIEIVDCIKNKKVTQNEVDRTTN